jgi:protein-disulfide isomerase
VPEILVFGEWETTMAALFHSILGRRLTSASLATLLLILTSAVPALAQAPSMPSPADPQDIRQELTALREAQQAIAAEVTAIRTMLEQAMGPRPAPAAGGAVAAGAGAQPLTIAGRPSRGNPRAKVTVVEYSDYECPYCGQYVADVYGQIDRDYIKTNKINYVFKNYPITQLHPASIKAHKAAACAGDQGRYWEMHDKLFADQRNFNLDRFVEHASMLKLDAVAFRACLESTKHEDVIQQDVLEAQNGGVQGTPVFVFALTDPNGKQITPARVLVGAQPYAAFKDAIDAMLAQANPGTR